MHLILCLQLKLVHSHAMNTSWFAEIKARLCLGYFYQKSSNFDSTNLSRYICVWSCISLVTTHSKQCHGFSLFLTQVSSPPGFMVWEPFCGQDFNPIRFNPRNWCLWQLLWIRAAPSFCGFEQRPPSVDSSSFLLLWTRAASSFCGFEQLPSENLNIVL